MGQLGRWLSQDIALAFYGRNSSERASGLGFERCTTHPELPTGPLAPAKRHIKRKRCTADARKGVRRMKRSSRAWKKRGKQRWKWRKKKMRRRKRAQKLRKK